MNISPQIFSDPKYFTPQDIRLHLNKLYTNYKSIQFMVTTVDKLGKLNVDHYDIFKKTVSGYKLAFREGAAYLLRNTKDQLAVGAVGASVASAYSFLGLDLGVIIASGSAGVIGAAGVCVAGAAAVGGGIGTAITYTIYGAETISDTKRDLIRFEKQANSRVAKLGFRILGGFFW